MNILATLEKIHANESPAPRIDASLDHNRVVNEHDEAIFEESLKNADKVVLYFHGQVGDRGKSNRVATYKGIQEAIPSAHIVTIDCRGYGDSEGFPSEQGFQIDAFAAWKWVTQRVPSERIIIYGHSLGSGIATNLCLQLEEHQIAPLAMVLDAAFTSMPDMMTAYRKIPIVRPFARFPFLLNHFKMRLMDRFETVRAVETIKSPLLLIHGQEDADVIISNSHTLFHTALTARRLQSCTKELAVTEAGEAASAEDELARAGLDFSFQLGHSTSRDIQSATETGVHQRTHGSSQQRHEKELLRKATESAHEIEPRPPSSGSDSGVGSEATSGNSSGFATSPSRGLKESTEPENDRLTEHGHGYCHTVQLDFPREGTLEYNHEYQIGFLTVQYAVHNTCMDFAISKEVLGSFLWTAESRNRDGLNSHTAVLDLVKVLCRNKIGYVDQSDVPEVVE
ncbi:Monoacylglycerol lipase abhd12 [Mortierella sp. AD011]|nr:Monoacylglycerol lipase abhd12 [Mortierella sp. AD010]KAF9398218.1 Monoacylglycerol lipase abhd12 [Mortierella sp. AD011]